jgi:hypothetical protein
MNNLETLRRFAGPLARAATDIFDIDVAIPRNDGSTDRYIPGPLCELMPAIYYVAARGVQQSGSVDIEPAPEDAPVSDFDVLDQLRTPKGQIQRQIMAFRLSGGLPYHERLARRLEFLLDASEEEQETWADASPDSLRQMLFFLRATPDLRCPTVTITPSATFRVEWQAIKTGISR